MRRLVLLFMFSSIATLIPWNSAWAQCPDPVDQVFLFPQHQTSGIPRNVVLRAEFPPTRDPRNAPTWRVLDDHGARVEGEALWDGFMSTFTPHEELGERRTYTTRVTAQATGEYWQANFATGSTNDGEAPRFGGVSSVSWGERSEDWLIENCSLALGNGFLFTMTFASASDDATEREDLCHYIYLTKGPGADDARPIARVRLSEDNRIILIRPVEDGEGELCFRSEVRDLAGRFDGNDEEVCVDAVSGAIFDDICAAVGPKPRMGRPELLWSLVVILFCLWRRRARRKALYSRQSMP